MEKIVEVLTNAKGLEYNIENKIEDFVCDNLMIKQEKMQVFIEDNEIELTVTEYKILLFLIKYPNQVLSHKQIYEAVWEKEYVHDDANITSHISHIRKKIEPDPNHPIYIQTVRGVGYKFVKQ